MKKYFFVFVMLVSTKCFAQLNIVPMPAEVKMGKGNCILNNNFLIRYDGRLDVQKQNASYLQNKLSRWNLKCNVKNTLDVSQAPSSITLITDADKNNDSISKYKLDITKNSITIYGSQKSIFYGIQTLLQLLPVSTNKYSTSNTQLSIPQLSITDYPRFAYRGMHLDCGRHFFSVSFIKKYIDYLATYKFNTFHWHLTEDQGWRIEIKKYPLLTQVGAYRDRTLIGRYGSKKYDNQKYGDFYTQDQIKEIVKYASDRYITVIPEIEMPGHSTAALASYPFLGCTKGPYKVMDTWGVLDDVYCAGNDSTFVFLQNVLDEVMQLFPSKYIHIGGDECPKLRWKKCSACQKRIADNNLKDEHGLQSYFIQRIEKYLNNKGRKIIGWDEILEGGLAPNATVMSWRGEVGGIEAAKQNHDVIMTPGTPVYFDHSQSKNEDSLTIGGYNSLEMVYNYEPVPAILNTTQAKHILGAQGNVWTEYMANASKVEYMIFPRMIALSEVLWSQKEKRNYNDFEKRLPTIFERLDTAKINYSKAYFDLKASVLPTDDFNGVLWKLDSKINTPITINFNNADSVWSYTKPQLVNAGIFLATASSKGTTLSQKFFFNKATGKKIILANEPSKNYIGDGAFTLVNGVQNEKGLARSSEFLGFLGTDLDVTIDLGSIMDVKKIRLHVFGQSSSWIYLPSNVAVTYLYGINDSKTPLLGPPTKISSVDVAHADGNSTIDITGNHTCRYIRIVAKNFGTIPLGNPGAGTPAWLFADEIEVE